jgi:hypothetical protein
VARGVEPLLQSHNLECSRYTSATANLLSERQQQPIQSDGPADAFRIPSSAGDLLLCAELLAFHLEAVLDVVGQSTLDGGNESIRKAEVVKAFSQDGYRLFLRCVQAENLNADLRELAVAASLGAFVTVAAGDVEEANGLGERAFPLVAVKLLNDAGSLGDQADISSALILEGPHLTKNGRTGGFFLEGALLPEGREDDFAEAFSDEDASVDGSQLR